MARRVVVVAALAVAAAAAVMAYLALPPADAPPPPPPTRDTDTMRFDESPPAAGPASPDGSLPGVLGVPAGADASDLMLLQRGDERFTGEPAGLPPYPGPSATRRVGFRRRAAGYVEEFAFWHVKGAGVQDALAFYDQAAADAGFGTAGQPRRAANSRQVTKIYLRSASGSGLASGGGSGGASGGGSGGGSGGASGGVRLTVGVTPVGDGVRIVLWSHRRAQPDPK